ncbi:MAG: hypothetical protein EBR82_72270 [Caulobacteraceae bacterium]|nr:hypothetical protein [Caulobacteraceae bacterium]
MKFNWEKSSRTIEVTELPRRVAGVVAADDLTLEVNYSGGSSCRKGITLDNAVMPLAAAAPELLAALKFAAEVLKHHDIDEWLSGEFKIITDAIAKAEGKTDAIAFEKPIA